MTMKKAHPILVADKSVLTRSHIFFLDLQCARVWMTGQGKPLGRLATHVSSGWYVYTAMLATFAIMAVHPSLLAAFVCNVLGKMTTTAASDDKGTGPQIVIVGTLFVCSFSVGAFVLKIV